jgi:hypothetical protein
MDKNPAIVTLTGVQAMEVQEPILLSAITQFHTTLLTNTEKGVKKI